ncbi:MAG: aminofutalosine synthase MqnE [Thermodesulfovibrionales bacterium]|nr:aminofutalosine synthase MqnE [Thermodesulfovibrionales bacterium]
MFNHSIPQIEDILTKAVNSKPITRQQAISLYKPSLLHTVGKVADEISNRLHNKRAFYVINRHINPTNICVNRCKFCAYSRSKGDADAFELTIDEILQKLRSTEVDFKEVHIVGGLHPDWGLREYLDIVRSVRQSFPDVAIKAYSAVEIDYISRVSNKDIRYVLMSLKDAGLSMLPGGGAEIFNPEVRQRLCPEKISGDRWLEIMETAHLLGIPSNATMLYGHIENLDDRIEHMVKIRELQEKTGGFQAFIPLAYHPKNTEVGGKHTSGVDDLLTIAISRIVLQNIPHIKAYWIMLGEKIAQTALLFGADDLDGTIIEEKITHSAGAQTRESISEEALKRLIQKTGKIPTKRDGFYNNI